MKGKAAVFTGVDKPIEIREYPLSPVKPEEVLVRISMCSVCGSDYHTWAGHRPGRTPSILGHEITGKIVELGIGIKQDVLGNLLNVGDRITWSLYSNCGSCYFCRVAMLPQKCINLYKYGHESCEKAPYFNGGFAEYIYLRPGTAILKVPDELSDEEVTPINCSTSTVAACLDYSSFKSGDFVVVQGVGMLGINACAMLKDRGAGWVVAIDVDKNRLDMAQKFGADELINVQDNTIDRITYRGQNPDLVIEATGDPAMIPLGLKLLRIGGSYSLLGLVSPGAHVEIDGYTIVSKHLTIQGIHNYHTRHLVQALDFIYRAKNRFPFKELTTRHFPLAETEQALQLFANKEAVRPVIVPGMD